MAKQTKKLIDLHQAFLAEFNKVQKVLAPEREQSLNDRRFYIIAGAQWEGNAGKQFENKPTLEINKTQLAITRIKSEYLNNRVSVDFISRTGDKNDDLADFCDALYRADEQDSNADEAYDNAFEEGIGGGIGAWRYRAVYEDENDPENDFQRIKIEPIFDADSCVFFDLGSKRQDKSDAKRCWVISSMPIDDFIEEYNEDPASWPKEVTQAEFDWVTPDVVFIAEVYNVETEKVTWRTFKTLTGDIQRYTDSELEDEPDILTALNATGAEELAPRITRRTRVHKYLMSGSRILEDCGFIPGPNIPITVNYGKRWIVDGIERASGHVRTTKDCQILKNIQVSKLADMSTKSSIEKPIFSREQVDGHMLRWADDNVKDYPFMLINLIENPTGDGTVAGPLGWTKPPQVPPALAVLLQQTENDIKDLLGSQEQAEQLHPNISGLAVEMVQNQLGLQNFVYLSNHAKAMKRGGEIWLGMAKELYVEKNRKMLGINKQGKTRPLIINELVEDQVNGAVTFANDLSRANLKVYADVGPSSTSRRQAVVRSLSTVLSVTRDPDTIDILNSLIMMNLEGEGVSESRKYFRKKLIKRGVIEPSKDEAQELLEAAQNAPKDPNALFLEAAAKSEEAKAGLNEAKTLETLASVEETRAKTLKTLSEVENNPAAERTLSELQPGRQTTTT